jgi:hypothetical protein
MRLAPIVLAVFALFLAFAPAAPGGVSSLANDMEGLVNSSTARELEATTLSELTSSSTRRTYKQLLKQHGQELGADAANVLKLGLHLNRPSNRALLEDLRSGEPPGPRRLENLHALLSAIARSPATSALIEKGERLKRHPALIRGLLAELRSRIEKAAPSAYRDGLLRVLSALRIRRHILKLPPLTLALLASPPPRALPFPGSRRAGALASASATGTAWRATAHRAVAQVKSWLGQVSQWVGREIQEHPGVAKWVKDNLTEHALASYFRSIFGIASGPVAKLLPYLACQVDTLVYLLSSQAYPQGGLGLQPVDVRPPPACSTSPFSRRSANPGRRFAMSCGADPQGPASATRLASATQYVPFSQQLEAKVPVKAGTWYLANSPSAHSRVFVTSEGILEGVVGVVGDWTFTVQATGLGGEAVVQKVTLPVSPTTCASFPCMIPDGDKKFTFVWNGNPAYWNGAPCSPCSGAWTLIIEATLVGTYARNVVGGWNPEHFACLGGEAAERCTTTFDFKWYGAAFIPATSHVSVYYEHGPGEVIPVGAWDVAL